MLFYGVPDNILELVNIISEFDFETKPDLSLIDRVF